jgi:hypothetical protein
MEKEHSMPDIRISKENFPGAIKQLMDRYRVFAPVKKGRFHEFALLQNVEQADLGFSNTLLSPKGLFHPQAERMFEYSLAREDPNAGILKRISRRESFWEYGRATQRLLNSMTPISIQKASRTPGGFKGARQLP